MHARYGVKSFILFPKIEDNLKSNYGEEAHNPGEGATSLVWAPRPLVLLLIMS